MYESDYQIVFSEARVLAKDVGVILIHLMTLNYGGNLLNVFDGLLTFNDDP